MKRRTLTKLSLLGTTPFAMLGCGLLRNSESGRSTSSVAGGYGPLITDPNKVLDLPAGFSAVVLQRAGDSLSDGYTMPGQPDGMTCHTDSEGNYVLLRNHELTTRDWCERSGVPINEYTDKQKLYHPEKLGGVSRVVVNPAQLNAALKTSQNGVAAIVSSNMVLIGTQNNCSGGVVEDGWISCEESTQDQHGYAFHTRIDDAQIVDPLERRITSWGRMKREGVSIDTDLGLVYMTEDHKNGCLYRFLPNDAQKIYESGTVQALVLEALPDSDPDIALTQGSIWKTTWVDIPDPQATHTACRKQGTASGATRFNRVEGSVWDGQYLWFIASTAGPLGAGQIWRYDPLREETLLFLQVHDRRILSMPDNVTLSPWGDLMVAEDNYNATDGVEYQHLRIIGKDGTIQDFARNPVNAPIGRSDAPGGELTGCCFSPDGKILFVNIQAPRHMTIAVTGPWPTSGSTKG